MPLSERARIEIYLPDLPAESYQVLLNALQQELTYTFGGCSVLRGVDGSYLSLDGSPISDRISILYSDAPFEFDEHFLTISRYADELREAVLEALEEEAVLVVAMKVFHAT